MDTKEVIGRARVGAQAEKCHEACLPIQFSKCFSWDISHYLTFSFLYRVCIPLPQLLLVFTPIITAKAICEVDWKIFWKKGVVWIQKCWIGLLNLAPCPNSVPWESPEEMSLPGLVTFVNGFFPLCVGVLRTY